MFQRGERVYWVAHGIRSFGTIENLPAGSLKAQVRPASGHAEEMLVRRLYRAPPGANNARRIIERRAERSLDDPSLDLAHREASFIASDGSVDRFGDVIDPAGWDLTEYRRNPVFLWQHDVTEPIGTVPNIAVDKKQRLIARAKFIDASLSPLADKLFRLVAAGHLCAVSIGARALVEPEPIRDKEEHITGFRYGSMELLELSLVSVPANPNALILGRSIGCEEELLSQAFEGDVSVANLPAYYTRLRAQVPGLLAPRPAKSSNLSPERDP